MEELKLKIQELENKLAKLESQMSYEMSESLKDRFFLGDTDASTQTIATKNISLTGEAQTIAVADETKIPKVSGSIRLDFKGKIYNLLYE